MATDIFPFGRLPPELRIEIYELTLGTGNNIEVRRSRPDTCDPFELSAVVIAQTTRTTTRGGRIRTSTTTIPFLSESGTAILRVNKLTCAEALPVLYATNSFTFNTVPTLDQFAKQARKGVLQLRNITLATWSTTSMAKALRRLRGSNDLRRLTIVLSPCLDSLDYTAKQLYEGVRAFVVTGSDAAARRYRFNILHFDVNTDKVSRSLKGWKLQVEEGDDLEVVAADKVKARLEEILVSRMELGRSNRQ